jgi:flavin-dependent dehydrogenase
VIDASGQQLVLAKKNQWIEYDQKYKFQSFWAYYDHTSYLNASCQIKPFDERFTDPPMTLISSTGDWGWIWKIMLRDKVSIGAIIPQEHLGRFKAYGSGLKDRFTNYLADAPLISTMIAGSTLISDVMSVKDYTYRSRHFAFDQCYLIGDAVAFFDPINSEGITMAMYSGYLAAWAIAGSIIKPQRKLFYRDSYIRNMKTRLTLFYLLTYPEKNIPEELLLSIRESILQQSNTENHLTFSQLTLTNRGRGFDDILKQYGMNMDQVIRNVELPGEFG